VGNVLPSKHEKVLIQAIRFLR